MSWFVPTVKDKKRLPSARSHHAVASFEDSLILFGGEARSGALLNDTHMFYYESLSWESLKTSGGKPTPRLLHTLTPISSKLCLLYGGYDGENYLKSLFIFDTKRLKWSKIRTSRGSPIPVSGHSATIVDNIIYFFGGRNHDGLLNTLSCLYLDTMEWVDIQCKGSVPSPRRGHTTVSHGKDLYLYGGESNDDNYNEFYRYNIESETWYKIQTFGDFPNNRYFHTACIYGDILVVFGGINENIIGRKSKNEIWENDWDLVYTCDVSKDHRVWQKRFVAIGHSDISIERVYGHVAIFRKSAIHTSSKIFIFGGKQITNFAIRKRKKYVIREKSCNQLSILYHLPELYTNNTNVNTSLEREKFAERGKKKSVAKLRGLINGTPKRGYLEEKEKKKKENKRMKKKMKNADGGIGLPTGFHHVGHLSLDMEWTMEGLEPDDVFQLKDKLGEGAFGAVYKAHFMFKNGVVQESNEKPFELAVKEIRDIQDEEEIKNEIDILKKCSHPNIVSYYGTCMNRANLWILMDYCAFGSVRDMMNIRKRPLSELQIAWVTFNSLKGLMYLHGRGIIHRDIKAANILLKFENNNPQVLIADFGVSDRLESVKSDHDAVGTPNWIAPEVLNNQGADESSDIWSMAITVIEMYDGYPPNHKISTMRAMRIIKNPKMPPPTFSDPTEQSPELLDIVTICLKKEPTERPDIGTLLTHPFLLNAIQGQFNDELRETMSDALNDIEEHRSEKNRKSLRKRAAANAKEICTRPTNRINSDETMRAPSSPSRDISPSKSKETKKKRRLSINFKNKDKLDLSDTEPNQKKIEPSVRISVAEPQVIKYTVNIDIDGEENEIKKQDLGTLIEHTSTSENSTIDHENDSELADSVIEYEDEGTFVDHEYESESENSVVYYDDNGTFIEHSVIDYEDAGTFIEHGSNDSVIDYEDAGTFIEHGSNDSVIDYEDAGTFIEHGSNDSVIDYIDSGTFIEHGSNDSVIDYEDAGTFIEHGSADSVLEYEDAGTFIEHGSTDSIIEYDNVGTFIEHENVVQEDTTNDEAQTNEYSSQSEEIFKFALHTDSDDSEIDIESSSEEFIYGLSTKDIKYKENALRRPQGRTRIGSYVFKPSDEYQKATSKRNLLDALSDTETTEEPVLTPQESKHKLAKYRKIIKSLKFENKELRERVVELEGLVNSGA
eukprot:TRINITY_DN895_c0_g1_i4.p1 TRINITY_DN895_c0_g1~~TRINITY_DN895_c0_g1_i4.p1  ORF type:complete len:1176 (-),score=322.74 TRINITY_DN895_c0_g1_i4:66-3593(-)